MKCVYVYVCVGCVCVCMHKGWERKDNVKKCTQRSRLAWQDSQTEERTGMRLRDRETIQESIS